MKSQIPLMAIALLSVSAHAQTPDGLAPVNEGVCDDLIGGTPGLYGLCVAFCEAQDCTAPADLTSPAAWRDKNFATGLQ